MAETEKLLHETRTELKALTEKVFYLRFIILSVIS